jgi:UDP-2,3-diacylglucosamine hydrolase
MPTGRVVSGTTLLISDLHLAIDCPTIARRFRRFLHGPAREAAALYILGDLFEVWIGDDDTDNTFNESVLNDLAELTRSGVVVRFTRGNRDFLCGQTSARRAGWQILDDETRLAFDAEAAADADIHPAPAPHSAPPPHSTLLLLHGDTLCTDDHAYQRFRAVTHHRLVRTAFLCLPLKWRQRIARRLRQRSMAHQAHSSTSLGDVSERTVIERFRASGASLMIHGHTHRPARHELVVDGRPCVRWVLPDWTESKGGYVALEPGQPPRMVWFD